MDGTLFGGGERTIGDGGGGESTGGGGGGRALVRSLTIDTIQGV